MMALRYILLLLSVLTQSRALIDKLFRVNHSSQYVEAIEGKYLFPADDGLIGTFLSSIGQWEKPFKDLCFRLIQSFMDHYPDREVIIMDIGGNIGTWTIPLAKFVEGKGRVYTFEAQIDMMNYLNANIILNGLSNVYPIHGVVSNTSGEIIIQHVINSGIDRPNYGGFSIENLQQVNSENAQTARQSNSYFVEQYRLDDQLATGLIPSCPAFMKLDVEMHEINVFMGAQRLLESCKPMLFFEAECLLLLKSMIVMLDHIGYNLAWVGSPQIDLTAPFQGRLPDVYDDVYFANPEHGHMLVMGGSNIIAIPKYMGDVFRYFPDALYRIDTSTERYMIDDYGIIVCYKSYWCFAKQHSSYDLLNETCGESDAKISRYLQDYWKYFT